MAVTLSPGREGRGEAGAAVRRPKAQKGQITKMAGLYRKEPLGKERARIWAVEFRVGTGYAGHTLCQAGTEGCWECLQARPRFET